MNERQCTCDHYRSEHEWPEGYMPVAECRACSCATFTPTPLCGCHGEPMVRRGELFWCSNVRYIA